MSCGPFTEVLIVIATDADAYRAFRNRDSAALMNKLGTLWDQLTDPQRAALLEASQEDLVSACITQDTQVAIDLSIRLPNGDVKLRNFKVDIASKDRE